MADPTNDGNEDHHRPSRSSSDRPSSVLVDDAPRHDLEYIALDDLSVNNMRCLHPAPSVRLRASVCSQGSDRTVRASSSASTQEKQPDIEAPQHVPPKGPTASSSAMRRLGRLSLTILITAPLFTIAAVAFLSFLWFSNSGNASWQSIVVNQWATTATTITSLIIRTLTGLQAGVCVAMLAALALEAGSVRLGDAAVMSTARASGPGPHIVFLPIFHSSSVHRLWDSRLRFAIMIVLCITTYALQLCSTLLVSDLRVGLLPGLSEQKTVSYDFDYPLDNTYDPFDAPSSRTMSSGWYNFGVPRYALQPREPTWVRSPSSYPAFAEYAEPAPLNEDVDDTGLLLRAFLPFPEAQSRETIRNYTGKAMVLDSRVSCQRPKLDRLDFLWNAGGMLRIAVTGIYAPTWPAERVWSPSRPVPFYCSVYADSDAPPTICQLQQSPLDLMTSANGTLTDNIAWGNAGGGLVSEFSNLTDLTKLSQWIGDADQQRFITWGTAFLVFNASNHINKQWSTSSNYSMSDDRTARFRNNTIWTEVLTDRGVTNFSVSLCYAAWDTTRADVNMFSDQNRTESIAQWRKDNGFSTTPSLMHQLGSVQADDMSAESRNILTLAKKSSWITAAEDAIPFTIQPFVQNFGDGSGKTDGYLSGHPMTGNWTNILHVATPGFDDELRVSPGENAEALEAVSVDDTIATLFHQFYSSSGSLARTMSSMITVLSSMAYQDQLPRFQTTAETGQTYWISVPFPQAHAGFVAVVVLVMLHNMLVCIVLFLFLSNCRHSLIGSYWQSAAQLNSPQASEILLKSHEARDREVEKLLESTGRTKEKFRLEQRRESALSSEVNLVAGAGQPG